MKALSYLLLCKLKNSFVSVFKVPAKLVAAIILIALVAMSFFTQSGDVSYSAYFRDTNELYALVLLLYSIVFVLVSKNGFYNGASMFSMADVNMIFTSPLKQSKILSFGLFQQLGRSLIIGYVILYQYSFIKSTYGLPFSAVIYILIGYGVTIFLSQMTAMVIYSYTGSNEKKRIFVKIAYYLIIFTFVVYALALAWRNGEISIENLVVSTRSAFIRFFPVSGIMAFAVQSAIEGQLIGIIDGILYCVVFWIFYRIAILIINSDFYEDVLQSAEVSYSAIQSRREGKVSENAPRKIKLGKTGIEKGYGAAVIAQKHKVENRRSRVFLLSVSSVFTIGASVVGCFVFKDIPIGLLAMNIYLLTMSVATGRWAKELSYPYVYLIPEKPIKKLFYTIKGEFLPLTLESALCFAPAYFIMQLNIYDIFAMILVRISFGLLFLSINLLLQKIFAAADKKVFLMLVYFAFITVFSAPGIIAAVLLSMYYPFYMYIAYLALSFINIIVACVIAFCCKNVFLEV